MLIQFPYNAEAVEAIKELPARKWNPAERGWEIPDFLASAAAVKLEPFYPDIADALRSHVASVTVEARRDICLLYTSPSPRDGLLSRMPSSA